MMTALEFVQAFQPNGLPDNTLQSWSVGENFRVYYGLPEYLGQVGLSIHKPDGTRDNAIWTIEDPHRFFAWMGRCGLWTDEELEAINPYIVMALYEDTPSGG